MYYDRQGRPLTVRAWGELLERQPGLRRVAETTLPDGKWVSTVWIGLDHRFVGDGPPLIFETMVFPSKGGPMFSLDEWRWSTEAEALAGHADVVAKWTARCAPGGLTEGRE